MEIYNRQSQMSAHIPTSHICIGAGGVGGWNALFGALIGVKKTLIFDDDKVEEHNLNRGIFDYEDIGEYKANAIKRIIRRKRPTAQVYVFKEKVDSYTDVDEIEELTGITKPVITDNRDNNRPLHKKWSETKIIGGYDGWNFTLHENPKEKQIWDGVGVSGYQVTNSILLPPVFIATMIWTNITGEIVSKNKIKTMSMKDAYKKILSNGE